MTIHQQIGKAIGAHGMWKSRLQKAIDEGASRLSITVVRQDDQCDFGKWLHGNDLPLESKQTEHYKQCRHLHAQFHLAASKVLTLAIALKKTDALRAMDADGEFAAASSGLTKAMLDWDAAATRPAPAPTAAGQK